MLLEYKFLQVNKFLLIVTFTTICHDKLRKSAGIRVLLGEKNKTKQNLICTLFIPGGGNGNALQYSWLENHMERGTWWATVYRVMKRGTWL